MRGFDADIKWWRARRDISLQDLKEFEGGQRAMREMRETRWVDVTVEWIARTKADIYRFDLLIAAYERLNAKGGS